MIGVSTVLAFRYIILAKVPETPGKIPGIPGKTPGKVPVTPDQTPGIPGRTQLFMQNP